MTRDDVMEQIVKAINDLAGDWDYEGVLDENTRMFADMDVASLDLVTVASTMVNLYGPLPFDAFYQQLGEQPPQTREVTLGELADFVARHASPDRSRV